MLAIMKLTIVYAQSQVHTLFTIKLYSEPVDKIEKFTYSIDIPPGLNASYYVGGDLPSWHFSKDRVLKGQFRSVQLINIRIHPENKKHMLNEYELPITVKDQKHSCLLFQGKLIYSKDNNQIKAIVQKKDNMTKLKIDKAINTIWIEVNSCKAKDQARPH